LEHFNAHFLVLLDNVYVTAVWQFDKVSGICELAKSHFSGMLLLTGNCFRKLYDIWRQASVFSVVGSQTGLLNHGNTETDKQRFMVTEIQQLFHGIEIYPTESQVYEMIQCANLFSLNRSSALSTKKNGCNISGDNKEYLTFGEFCFFASELINSYRQK